MAPNNATALSRVTAPLYSFAEADSLARVPRGTSRRWLSGYAHLDTVGEVTVQAPATPGIAGDREGVSFSDLVEIVAIGGLRSLGFSMTRIREFVWSCQQDLGVDRPLTRLKFKTDGRDFFVDRGIHVLEVGKRRGNQAWKLVLEPVLQSLDYEGEVASRWWPMGKTSPVVVDPEYGFGFPVLSGSGIRTETILERFQAGDLDDQIAKDFNIDPIEVQRALRFESTRFEVDRAS